MRAEHRKQRACARFALDAPQAGFDDINFYVLCEHPRIHGTTVVRLHDLDRVVWHGDEVMIECSPECGYTHRWLGEFREITEFGRLKILSDELAFFGDINNTVLAQFDLP